MAVFTRFQLRSYEKAMGGKLKDDAARNDFVNKVQQLFAIWDEPIFDANPEQQRQVKFFSGMDGNRFKVFAFIPLKEGQTLREEWIPRSNATSDEKREFMEVVRTKRVDITLELAALAVLANNKKLTPLRLTIK